MYEIYKKPGWNVDGDAKMDELFNAWYKYGPT